MKKTMIVAMATMMAFMVGCDRTPSTDKINAVATLVGKTAGYACELSKTKTEVKEAIAKVLDIAATAVPTNGQTFAEAWTPIIDTELNKLVEAGKLDAAGAQVAKLALNVACDGIDYVFVKYPKAKEVKELVSAAVTGFVSGYKSVVTLAIGADKPEIDEDALKYLRDRMAK